MNTFFVVFLPNARVNDSSKEKDACSGHYVVLAIYKTFRHVSIYSSGSNQDGVLDELKPQIIGFLKNILLDVDNVTFSDFQHPNDKSYEWKIGLLDSISTSQLSLQFVNPWYCGVSFIFI